MKHSLGILAVLLWSSVQIFAQTDWYNPLVKGKSLYRDVAGMKRSVQNIIVFRTVQRRWYGKLCGICPVRVQACILSSRQMHRKYR